MKNLENKSQKEEIPILKQLDWAFVPTSGVRMLRNLEKEKGIESDFRIYLGMGAWEVARLAIYSYVIYQLLNK
ncbi:MAG: hypothetical protein Q8L29_01665 [archaeon]|nr:hypothetical protein [archaeon]